jgi:hypothetical protein
MHAPKPIHRFLLPALVVSVAANVWLLWQIRSAPPTSPVGEPHLSTTSLPNRARPPKISSEADHVSLLERAISRHEKPETLRLLAEAWATRSPKEALEWIQSNTEGVLNQELTLAGIQAWARVSPTAAADWAFHMPLGESREQTIAGLLETWATSDAPSAVAWLETLPGSSQPIAKEAWLLAADRTASVWAALDPAAAAAWAHRFQETHPKSRAFTQAMIAWGATDPTAGRAYFETLPAQTEIAVQAAAALGEGMARASSTQALDWALSLPADDTGWQARNAVLTQWAETSPSQAAQAVSAITDAEERTQHLGTILTQWAATHIDAAEAWARSLPQGQEHDQALNTLADSFATRHPAKALELALDIQSPTLRTQSAEGVLAWWREADKAAADDWLARANLREELRRALSTSEDADENEEP